MVSAVPPDLPPGLIVAGMHRSATSLVSSAFVLRGWHAPGALLAADSGNARGYFEDRAMHELHRRLLESYDTAWDLGPRLRRLRRKAPLSLDPRADRVAELVADFRSGGPWLWKNPRATLFLDAWAEQFPEATFVLCVRSPAAVADSMMRRGDRLRIPATGRLSKLRRVARMFSVWHSYNLLLYRFARANPDRAVVVRIPEDLPAVTKIDGQAVFDADLFHGRPRAKTRLMAAAAVSSQVLYQRLRRLHDPKRLADLLARTPVRRSVSPEA